MPGAPGVALISVLLLLFLASLLAASMLTRQRLDLQFAINRLDQAQALQYALGGEALARQLLHQDLSVGNLDHPGEPWAKTAAFDFPQGRLVLRIRDLQGLFNLNSLLLPGAPGRLAERRFRRLLARLELDPQLADQLLDYLDADQEARPGGAEDIDYLAETPPYRAANGPLAHPSELHWLQGMTAEAFARLSPWVTALPDPAAPININTAPVPLLLAILPELTRPEAEALSRRRLALAGFKSPGELAAQALVSAGTELVQGLSVGSGYYEVRIEARYNERTSRLHSILQRSRRTGELRVLARDLGQEPARPVPADADKPEVNPYG